MKETKNQRGARKMIKNDQKVPLYLLIGFDPINAYHLDRVRQIEILKSLRAR